MRYSTSFGFFLRRGGLVATAVLLTVGLTGCYTQLQTSDPWSETSAAVHSESDRSDADREAAPRADEPRYADEYRREYREDDASYARGEPEYRYEYKYRYKYGAPYRYGYVGFYDPFFDDPFFHGPFYRPYGSRSAFSIHFGSPFYAHRPFHYGYRPFHYSGFGSYYGGSYYVGNQYIYYGDVTDDRDRRTVQPRGATIGRGGTTADADRTASTRSATRSGTATATRTARIGRSTDRTSETRTTNRSRPGAPRARIGRSARGDRDRSAARIGRASRSDEARTARTRSERSEARRDGARTRSVRDRARSRDTDRLRADRRSTVERGRIGVRRSEGDADLRVRTPARIDASRYEQMRERWMRQQSERRWYERRSPFPERRTSAWSQPDRSERTRARSSSRSSGSDQGSSARSGSGRSSSGSDGGGGRSRSRGGDDEG